jgi:hypothetical protein
VNRPASFLGASFGGQKRLRKAASLFEPIHLAGQTELAFGPTGLDRIAPSGRLGPVIRGVPLFFGALDRFRVEMIRRRFWPILSEGQKRRREATRLLESVSCAGSTELVFGLGLRARL